MLFVATGAGAGLCPKIPGTAGTVVAVPLSIALNYIAARSLLVSVAILAWATVCAIVLSAIAADMLSAKDPSVIVIDEIAGFLLANFNAPAGLMPLLLAFVLFRLFDIVKVYPASYLQELSGGSGIVLDDMVAGLYTFAIIQLLSFGRLI
jgi:phosphatidylglycerophosphatase A